MSAPHGDEGFRNVLENHFILAGMRHRLVRSPADAGDRGGIALFAYATFAELGAFLTGTSAGTLDTAVAREMAHKMCGGYGVKAPGARRHYLP